MVFGISVCVCIYKYNGVKNACAFVRRTTDRKDTLLLLIIFFHYLYEQVEDYEYNNSDLGLGGEFETDLAIVARRSE